VSRGASASVDLLWDETNKYWSSTNNGTNYAPLARKFAQAVTFLSGASSAITHNLGTSDVVVSVRDNVGAQVFCDWTATSTSVVTLSWGIASGSGRVVIVG
jgi:hypothetical protein